MCKNTTINPELSDKPFNINSEEAQSALKLIKQNMITYSLTEIIVDLLEEIYILTHHKQVQFKASDLFEIIHVIENAELKMSDLRVMRTQMLEFVTKHPDVRNMEHLRNHIIVDFGKAVKHLESQFAIFVADLKLLKTYSALLQRMAEWLEEDRKTLSTVAMFYFWFDAILNANDTSLATRKLRESLLQRLKLERIMWQMPNHTAPPSYINSVSTIAY
ncbi:hypothetical protein CBL_10200 [Carabus blaptoides fortunei]